MRSRTVMVAHTACNCTKLSELLLSARGFPGGSVVKNPPANAGDTGLIPNPEESHMPRSYGARALEPGRSN